MKTYKTVVLSVLLYRHETWPHTPKEEHGLRDSENIST
jgi:hypothetical protein